MPLKSRQVFMIPGNLNSLKGMAEKVRFMSFDMIQLEDQQLRSHWYTQDSIDLYYFEKNDGSIAKIYINILGQVLDWNPLDGIRTGLMIEEEKATGLIEVVHYDSRASEKTVSQALLVLESAQQIPQTHRVLLQKCLHISAPVPFLQKIKNWWKAA